MTRRQKTLLDFIKQYQADNEGVSPSFDDMRQGIGLSSKSRVHALLKNLEEQGFIRRLKNRKRAIEVVAKPTMGRFDDLTSQDFAREAAKRGLVVGRLLNFPGGERKFSLIEVQPQV